MLAKQLYFINHLGPVTTCVREKFYSALNRFIFDIGVGKCSRTVSRIPFTLDSFLLTEILLLAAYGLPVSDSRLNVA